MLGKWCIEHYRRYGQPIGKQIETKFRHWAETNTDKDVIQQLERLLEYVNDEYARAAETPTQAYIDAIVDTVDRHRLSEARDEIEVMNGSTSDAIAAVTGFRSLRDELNVHAKGLVSASSIECRRVAWAWNAWLPYGELTVLDGDPGKGKSQIALNVTSRITRGHLMPPHPRKPGGRRDKINPGNVLYLSAEDAGGTVLVPRLIAAGADLSRVRVFGTESERIAFPEGMLTLARWVDEYRPALVVIDPIFAFLAGKVDTNTDSRIRNAVLAPLAKLAQSSGAAFLLIRHLNKKSDENVLYRGGGSIALIAQARSAWIVGTDPNDADVRILAPNKSSLGPPPTPLAYRIVSATIPTDDGDDCETSRIDWLGERDDIEAQDIVTRKRQPQGRPSKLQQVVECMQELLSNGKRIPSKQFVDEVCKRCNCSEETVKNARRQAKVKATRDSFGGDWICYLVDD
jgi:hypothetical protein